jgi:hypothetical protein
LPADSSLSRLLAAERGVFHHLEQPQLSEDQILAWADEHHRRTDTWPKKDSGPIEPTGGLDSWSHVDSALRTGARGLHGGSSLARLLAEEREVRNKSDLPCLIETEILRWADAHFARTREWPDYASGAIPEAPGETWSAVQTALLGGLRGFTGGSSIVRLLAQHRGVRSRTEPPSLTIEEILRWADAHHHRTGRWPTASTDPIFDAPGEIWGAVSTSLRVGLRGLPGGSSLARLLARERGVRNEKDLPRLTPDLILTWADAHHDRHGTWPTCGSGRIPDATGETWLNIHNALFQGHRGLPGGSSLARLLEERRGARNIGNLPRFSVEQILIWADAHRARTGRWPAVKSGPIAEAPGENWMGVQNALCIGLRGLPGGSSLARLLASERAIPRRASRGDEWTLSSRKDRGDCS